MAEAFPFREDSLLEAAKQATGLSDFAGEGFREGLRVLLEAYEKKLISVRRAASATGGARSSC